MSNFGALMMLQLQDNVALNGRDAHLLVIFVGIIMVAFVVLVLVLFVTAIMGMKLLGKVKTVAENAEQKAAPILAKTHTLLDDLSPKVSSIGANVEHITGTVRAKCDELGETVNGIKRTVDEINVRTRVQVQRVDGIVTEALRTTEEVSTKVQQGIRYPVNQIAAILEGLKVGLETLARRSPFGKKAVRNPYDM